MLTLPHLYTYLHKIVRFPVAPRVEVDVWGWAHPHIPLTERFLICYFEGPACTFTNNFNTFKTILKGLFTNEK